ncbi:MAG: hypothetical protein HN846_00055 [Candidatus Pacebacteria bacterium]|jgi:hypothetical protein|nr:hypothetical protein [Candidatus Paceibacterota bacterium]MBT3512170.1 hypothetical protein [Candidatus Paceibacterota bacterium]MBT4004897.1 hypothetical protein [Candidatus Paceibacterota bacterium]MBT4358661.1 hypothetical protein [Candidatus Paceibacterota bacterium]MBT4681344.1 hypothetical protein [Candidatus Paceibacterota bacterium]
MKTSPFQYTLESLHLGFNHQVDPLQIGPKRFDYLVFTSSISSDDQIDTLKKLESNHLIKIKDTKPANLFSPTRIELEVHDEKTFLSNLEILLIGSMVKQDAVIQNQKAVNRCHWDLVENPKNSEAYLQFEGQTVFTFHSRKSKRYLYFKLIWGNYPNKTNYDEIPFVPSFRKDQWKHKKYWEINRSTREIINDLKKDLIRNGVTAVQIETNRGFKLKIRGGHLAIPPYLLEKLDEN